MEIMPKRPAKHLFEQMTIGDLIRYLRELHGYKQSELAMKAGITQAAIGNLETDSSRKPSAPPCFAWHSPSSASRPGSSTASATPRPRAS